MQYPMSNQKINTILYKDTEVLVYVDMAVKIHFLKAVYKLLPPILQKTTSNLPIRTVHTR